MLQAGDIAPSYVLSGDNGRTLDSRSLQGQRHVLFFYPKDNTPGCTREACAFRDLHGNFEAIGVPVFGVSADIAATHDKFIRKHGLTFPLLSDPDHLMLEAFGVWVEKNLYGRKYMGVQRSTFVINATGAVERVWEKVSPDGHAADVLAYLIASGPPGKRRVAKPAKAR